MAYPAKSRRARVYTKKRLFLFAINANRKEESRRLSSGSWVGPADLLEDEVLDHPGGSDGVLFQKIKQAKSSQEIDSSFITMAIESRREREREREGRRFVLTSLGTM